MAVNPKITKNSIFFIPLFSAKIKPPLSVKEMNADELRNTEDGLQYKANEFLSNMSGRA